MCQELPFDPFPYLGEPNSQTIVNVYFNFFLETSWTQKLISLPDGDLLSHVVTTPSNWKPTDPTILLLHGLCGSHESPNPARMAHRLEKKGIRAIRLNMRGCGTGRGLSRGIYHGGRSEDILETLKVLKKEYPESPMILIGFSLGGNITLKLAGELGSFGKNFLEGAIAITPPADLSSSIKMLEGSDYGLYQRYFYKLLREDVHYIHKKFRDLPRIHLPKNLKLREFDQIYTAPSCGFLNADDYYSKCSSAQFVAGIQIPTKILFAEDDPIISSTSLDAYELPSNVSVFKTKKGGHMGYVGSPSSGKGVYWLDTLLMEWIEELLSPKPGSGLDGSRIVY